MRKLCTIEYTIVHKKNKSYIMYHILVVSFKTIITRETEAYLFFDAYRPGVCLEAS